MWQTTLGQMTIVSILKEARLLTEEQWRGDRGGQGGHAPQRRLQGGAKNVVSINILAKACYVQKKKLKERKDLKIKE